MFGIGIKNSLLVLVIILIIHFYIKTILLNNNIKNDKNTVIKEKDTKEKVVEKFNLEECRKFNQEVKVDTNDKEELFKYVFGDSKINLTHEDIDKYFSGEDVSKDVKSLKKNCPEPEKRITKDYLELENCGPELEKPSFNFEKDKKKNECNIVQNKNVLILSEYEKENSMNGGELYGGLNAYDTSGLNYLEFNCK